MQTIQSFLGPLEIDVQKTYNLAESFYHTFKKLAAESNDQFLPTPLFEGILKPEEDRSGR